MRSRLAACGWTLLLAGAVAAPAAAWQVHVGPGFGEDRAQAVAFLPRGDVVAAGITERSGDQGVATVVRLTPGGRLAWRTLVEPRGSQVRVLLVDGRGDVIVGALVGGSDESDLGRFTVVKLDGRTGIELWRSDPRGLRGSIALDRHDDVVLAAAWEVDDDEGVEPVCTTLDGRNGTVRWSRPACGEYVAIAPDGDVVAAYATTLRRLAPATGSERWHTALPIAARLLRVGTDGAIVVADTTRVLRLDAAGTLQWQRDLGIPPPLGGIRDVVPDDSGDLIVAGGTTFVPAVGTDLLVARLAAADGHERWRTVLDGMGDLDQDHAVAAGIGRRGEVLVAAWLEDGASARIAVLGVDGATGVVRWRRRPRGTGGVPTALAVSPRGFVAIGGGMVPPRAEDDDEIASFLVLRLAGRAIGPLRIR